jgi:hypothetical protein
MSITEECRRVAARESLEWTAKVNLVAAPPARRQIVLVLRGRSLTAPGGSGVFVRSAGSPTPATVNLAGR